MPEVRPLITLLTDFGDRDWFAASMKGVILSIHPEACIVDISHQISPHQIHEAAYVLESCYRYFPPGTVHVAVVDPGVGTCRRPLLVSTPRYHFLAPDNGLLTRVLRGEPEQEIRELHGANYRIETKGATFDGRDVFAPAAAWLSKGESVESLGRRVGDPVMLSVAEPVRQDQAMIGAIEYVDRFGNLISNVTREHLCEFGERARQQDLSIWVGSCVIRGIVSSYSEGKRDVPSALVNSCGKLEIFLDGNNASEVLKLGVGAVIRLG